MAGRGRWRTVAVVTPLAAVALLFAFARLFGPRAMAPARVADPRAALAAGRELVDSTSTAGATTLVVVAHPDDLEWWAGGTAALLARRGDVIVVVGTSGEKGDAGLVPNLGALRERLQLESARILGFRKVIFLRHPDGGLAQAAAFPSEVASAVAAYRPANILTFDVAREAAGYHHVDHEAAGRVTAAVTEQLGGVTLYLFHTSAPDVLVDYGPVRDEKARAFAVMTSYHNAVPVVGWIGEQLGRLIAGGAVSYGSRSAYPEMGVQFGEVFRRVVVPAK